jgi:hypothetical protein
MEKLGYNYTPMHNTQPTQGKELEAIAKLKQTYPHVALAFETLMNEQYALFAKKMCDYGLDNISVNTSLSTKEEVQLALTGIWFRMNDKMSRLKNLALLKGTQFSPNVLDESLTDTLQDLSIYAIIAQLVQNKDWKK